MRTKQIAVAIVCCVLVSVNANVHIDNPHFDAVEHSFTTGFKVGGYVTLMMTAFEAGDMSDSEMKAAYKLTSASVVQEYEQYLNRSNAELYVHHLNAALHGIEQIKTINYPTTAECKTLVKDLNELIDAHEEKRNANQDWLE